MKKVCLISGILVLVSLVSAFFFGAFTKINTVVLTQDGRYIGIKTESSFRLPWDEPQSYQELQIPNNGMLTLPSGTFNIYYPFDFGEGQ